MKKKYLLACVSLLSLVTLAACSSGQNSTTTEQSTTTEVTTESSTTETTTATSAAGLKESTVTFLTDAEIEAIQTIGDYKNAYSSLMNSYVTAFDELIAQLPSSTQDLLKPYRDQVSTMLDEQKASLEAQLATIGDDSTAIPAEARETVLSSLKSARDSLQTAMETARKQAESLLQ